MTHYLLERQQVIERSRREVFAFFSDALNLERLTPAFLGFRILTERPIKLRAGAVIDYRLRLFGVPVQWRTLIERWEPEQLFIDRQVKGPYQFWRHTHTFEELGPDRTLMRDRVEYDLPFGRLGRLTHSLVVRRVLQRIFDYRGEAIRQLLPPKMQPVSSPAASAAESPP